jgi:hypothetical protein
MMGTFVPQFHEKRLTLSEMEASFQEFIGGPDLIDIDETVRLMLADYFYGEQVPVSLGRHFYTENERTIAFPIGKLPTMSPQELASAIDTLGEIFWTMADTISHRVMPVTPAYSHRPNECFYKYFPMSKELVVYTPIMEGVLYPPGLLPIDGRAVIVTCSDTLPMSFKQPDQPGGVTGLTPL